MAAVVRPPKPLPDKEYSDATTSFGGFAGCAGRAVGDPHGRDGEDQADHASRATKGGDSTRQPPLDAEMIQKNIQEAVEIHVHNTTPHRKKPSGFQSFRLPEGA